jgi:CII-binding regulator of phage lambda lysogenization HflD
MPKKKALKNLADDVLFVHTSIKTILSIDAKVTEYVFNYQKYDQQKILDLNFKFLLEYVNFALDESERKISKLKLISLREYRKAIAKNKRIYNRLNTIERANIKDINAALDLFNAAADYLDNIEAVMPELYRDEKYRFINYNLAVDGIITTIFAGLAFAGKIGSNQLITAGFILLYAFIFVWLILQGIFKVSFKSIRN